VLSGELRLEGSLERVREIRGADGARARCATARCGRIPVMQALFSQLGFDDTAVFERMRTRFQVRDGAFHMSDMQVYSPLLQLVGEGTLDMEGRLHHDLEVRYSLIDRLGPFHAARLLDPEQPVAPGELRGRHVEAARRAAGRSSRCSRRDLRRRPRPAAARRWRRSAGASSGHASEHGHFPTSTAC
jgi:hypothetical protein